MKRLALFLVLLVILTGCVPLQSRIYPTPTPTPEMLIVRRTDPTREPTKTPRIPDSILTVTALNIYQPLPTSTSRAFEPVVIRDFSLEFLGYSLRTSVTGIDYIEINYRFTNNSTETTSFGLSFSTDAFQNGIELPIYIALNSESMTDIRPGRSIVVKDAFQIRSDYPVIELEFRPFLEVWQNPVTRTIRLPQ